MDQAKTYTGIVRGKSSAPGKNSTTYKVSVDIGGDRTITLNTKDKDKWEAIEFEGNYQFAYAETSFEVDLPDGGKETRTMKWINDFKIVAVDHPTEEEVESDNMNREIDIKDVTF